MSEKPRIIAGSGRSGTTWIQDVLAEVNGLRTIFEPLHPQAVSEAEPYAWRYIPPGTDMADLEMFLNRVISGSLHTIWTDYRIRPSRLMPRWRRFSSPGRVYELYSEWRGATRRYFKYRSRFGISPVLIKIIRGNLMLGWLRAKYDARIVFVARHPGAVIESKMRLGGISWDPETMIKYYRTAGILGDCLGRYRELLEEDLSPVEAHTLIWCIENQLPLEQAGKQGYLSVFYEDLVRDGEKEWLRITNALNLTSSPWGSAVVDQPSQQSTPARARRKLGADSNWYDRMSEKELEAIQQVLNAVEMNVYTAFDPLPQHDNIIV